MDLLLNLTKEVLYVTAAITGGAIRALHLTCVLAKEKLAKLLQYVNISLHILLFGILMLAEVKIDLTVAFFSCSVFLYVLISYLKYEIRKKARNATSRVKEAKNSDV